MSKTRTTLFPSGVSNATPNSFEALANLRIGDLTKYHSFFDDFDLFNEAVAGEDWVITLTNATAVLANGDGGIVSLTTAGADNDSAFVMLRREGFSYAADKEFWFKIKLNISQATLPDIIAGLWGVSSTDPIDTPPSRGIFFRKDSGTDLFSFILVESGTETEFVISTAVVADTEVEMAFHYDGIGTFTLYQDDVLVGTVTDLTNVPLESTEQTVGFGVQNGNAAARNMLVDYVMAVKER